MFSKHNQSYYRFLKTFSVLILLLCKGIFGHAQVGTSWTSRASAADNSWASVAYGSGLFVAVGFSGTGNRVMTSPDGVTWTSRASAADNNWLSVTYGNNLFVAVASVGTNRVMTSPDGITWTPRLSAAEANQWTAVTYGNGLFVAVAQSGVGNRVMTSPDGINWTIRSSAADNGWVTVTYGNGLFVATAITGVGNRVMTSPDGINWTTRSSVADNAWLGACFGNNLFVAVANSGATQVMTSPDGINWTDRTSAAPNGWRSVVYGNGLFVSVSSSGIGNRVMTSPDCINWTSRSSAADNFWRSVTFANGIFVAVGQTGTGNRVMTSGSFSTLPVSWISFTAKNIGGKNELSWKTASEIRNSRFEIERSADARSFQTIGEVVASGSSMGGDYLFTDNSPSTNKTYYRLKQVDLDGKFYYSKIVVVENSRQLSFSLYPNPSDDQVKVNGLPESNTPYRFVISNVNGQIVLSNLLPVNGIIDIRSLPAGLYQLTIGTMTRKLVKQ